MRGRSRVQTVRVSTLFCRSHAQTKTRQPHAQHALDTLLNNISSPVSNINRSKQSGRILISIIETSQLYNLQYHIFFNSSSHDRARGGENRSVMPARAAMNITKISENALIFLETCVFKLRSSESLPVQMYFFKYNDTALTQIICSVCVRLNILRQMNSSSSVHKHR